jgi:hypothetical protein
MSRRVVLAALIAVVFAVGVHSLATAAKLPKCASVKCRDLGCPADVVCVSGSQVRSCAEVCGGR